MKRFHKPGDEKRSVVIVPPAEYEGWLASKSMDEARSFLNLFPADLMQAAPFPAPPGADVVTTRNKKAPLMSGAILGVRSDRWR